MLQSFRSLVNSVVGKVFFAILLGTFGLLGVGYGMRDLVFSVTSNNDAASVNGTKITLNDLNRDFHRQLSVAERQMGPSFAPTQQQKQEIARETLDRQVMDLLVGQAAVHDGFLISDEVVRKVIQSDPSFRGLGGRFDQSRFEMALRNEGMSEATFVPQIKAGLARQLLINPIAESAVAPKALVDDLYRYRNEQRVAETVTLLNSAATGLPKPTDADIDGYYKKHSVEFTAPEYRTFTVLPVTPDLFMAGINPSDDKLHEMYDTHKDEYTEPEKRKITQAVLSDKATADAVVKAASGGKKLADAVKETTSGKTQALTLDFQPKIALPAALRDPVFAGAKGSVVGPVQTPLGWNIAQVDDIQAGHDVPFETAKPKLTEQAKRDEAINILAERIDKIGDKLTGGAPMDQVATEINATLVKIGPVDAKGEPPAGAQKPDADKPKPNAAFVTTAFGLQQGETSQFEDDKNGGYSAVRLDSITPPALRPLAEVRDAVIAGWTKEKQAEAAAKQAEALLAKAKAGTPLSQIAAEAGVKVETSQPMTREQDSAGPGSPSPLLVDSLFQLAKVGDVTSIETDDGQVIARLSEIRAADPAKGGAKLSTLSENVTRDMMGDAMAEFRTGLREQAKIKMNPRAVELVAGQ
jgi:peptidyl-prolyl cis-trans isomerase D